LKVLQVKGQGIGASKKKNYKKNIFSGNKSTENNYSKERVKSKVTHLVTIVVKWIALHLNAGKYLMQNAANVTNLVMKL